MSGPHGYSKSAATPHGPGDSGCPQSQATVGIYAEKLDKADDFGGPSGDKNAECEPMLDMEAGPPIILDIQSNDLQEITAAEQTADIELFDK
ncbi:GL22357 [Drosophila persimilis]|uniref:GL22357 n=1 Tax=Drosophila persimilis TaxID=7234 RepID=B4HDE9_DROPE|nr:GL22357 [Drosophila persimilis]